MIVWRQATSIMSAKQEKWSIKKIFFKTTINNFTIKQYLYQNYSAWKQSPTNIWLFAYAISSAFLNALLTMTAYDSGILHQTYLVCTSENNYKRLNEILKKEKNYQPIPKMLGQN